jgi:hypothetical protein
LCPIELPLIDVWDRRDSQKPRPGDFSSVSGPPAMTAKHPEISVRVEASGDDCWRRALISTENQRHASTSAVIFTGAQRLRCGDGGA